MYIPFLSIVSRRIRNFLLFVIRRFSSGSPPRFRVRMQHACVALSAAFLPATVIAQTIDIQATIGPVMVWGDNIPLEFSWDRIDVSGHVTEADYPIARIDRTTDSPIAYPFEVAASSGNSWLDFSLAGPDSRMILLAHLEQHDVTGPQAESLDFEIRGWIADIIVPAYMAAAMWLDITIDAKGSETPVYTVSASLETSEGTRVLTLLGEDTRNAMSGTTTFNNSLGATPLHTGPVYFVASFNVVTMPIPEPSRAWMMVGGLILIFGLYRSTRFGRTQGAGA